MAASVAAAPAAVGQKRRGEHEQSGLRVGVTRLPGVKRSGVREQDRIPVRVIDGQPCRVWLVQRSGRPGLIHLARLARCRVESPARSLAATDDRSLPPKTVGCHRRP
jgi:hypothetical protein